MKKIRAKTRDVAFSFRMGAGFPGDVNRTHPCSIEPVQSNTAAPLNAFGQPCLVATDGVSVRPYTAGDTLAVAYGVVVRPYPVQQSTASNFGEAGFGNGVPMAGVQDVLRAGYIMTNIPAGQAAKKAGTVYVWTAASAPGHIQGGLEAVNPAGNGIALTNCQFNGPADASGNVELAFNI